MTDFLNACDILPRERCLVKEGLDECVLSSGSERRTNGRPSSCCGGLRRFVAEAQFPKVAKSKSQMSFNREHGG